MLYLYSAHMLYSLQDMRLIIDFWADSQFPGNIKNFLNAVSSVEIAQITAGKACTTLRPLEQNVT